MCFRWVEDSENWLAVGSPKTCLFRKGSSGIAGHLASSVLGRWWVPVLSIVSRPAHRIPPVSCTSLLTQSWWPMHRCLSQPTTSPHCLALTLSGSTRSHTVSLYLVLTLRHVRFIAPAVIWYLPLSTSHTVSLYSAYTWLCVARQDDSTHRHWATHGSTHHSTHRYHPLLLLQVLLRTHTVVPTTAALLLHHTAHRSSHQPLLH